MPKQTKRPVFQYSKTSGFLLREFKSVKEASETTGVGVGSINLTLKGKSFTAGGFIWTTSKQQKIDTKEYLKEKQK